MSVLSADDSDRYGCNNRRMYYWPRRPPRKPRAAPSRPPAVATLMASEFRDRPFGGSYGEALPIPPPAPPAPKPFVVEPWPEEQRRAEQAARQPEPAPAPVSALQVMMERARELGELEEPRAPGPPAECTPVYRFRPPEPNWTEEERERLARDQAEKAAAAQAALEPEAESYPAKRRSPRLDLIRIWLDGS